MVLINLFDVVHGKDYSLEVTDEVAREAMNDPMFATRLLEVEIGRQVKEHSKGSVAHVHDGEECSGAAPEPLDDDGFRWGHDAILLLVETFREEEKLFQTKKVSAKKMWDRIAAVLQAQAIQVSGAQCKSKINGLKKTYKNIKDANNRSGSGRRTWAYFDLLDGLFAEKPWVAPVMTLESDAMPEPSGLQSSPQNSRKRSRDETVATLMEALKQNREERRVQNEERRRQHEEVMARQDEYLALLRRLVEK